MGQTSYDAYTREMAVLPITIEMETKGVLISPEIHNELDKWRSELNECEMVLTDLAEGAKVGSKAMYEVLTSKGVIDASKLQRTDKGNFSYSRNNLPAAVTDSAVLGLLERRSELQKIVTTYLEPWSESASRNQGRLYPFFHSTRSHDYGARTGRFCIAKGSRVQQPGRSTAIEDVEEGSLVYTYDNDLKLCLRKVVSKAMTGYRELVRVSWKVNGSGAEGYLECTPDHRIRLVSGEYVEAQHLKANDRVLAVRRDESGAYNRLNSTRQSWARGGKKECVVIAELFLGRELAADECVHHIDGDRKNDSEGNLLVMKSQHHTQYHNSRMDPEVLDNYNLDGDFIVNEYGELVDLTRKDLTNALEAAAGVASRAAYMLELKPFVFRDLCRRFGININEFKERFTRSGKEITIELVIEARALNEKYSIESACSFLGIGWQRWHRIQRMFGFDPVPPKGNHIVTSVEWVEHKSDVYDLEIEDTHNFIANEICVHNSSNLQQVPRSPKNNNVPNLRRMIIAEAGHVLIGRDFSSQEIRVAAHYAEGKVLKAYQENPSLDVHSFVIDLVFKATGVKLERQVAKAISFLKMYGGGPNAMAANLDISVDEAASFFSAYDAALPEFKELSKEVEALVKDQGFIRTWGGRKYGVEAPVRVGGRLRTFYYKLVNVLVQGSSADMTKEAMIRYHYHPLRDKRSRIMLTIHDELVLHCPEDCVVEEQERLRWAMDEIPGWEVPLLSEGAVGRTMGDLK